GALGAAGGGPPGPHVIDAGRRSGPDAECVDGESVLGLPVSHTSRSVQEEVGGGQKAKARPRGAEPLELMIGGQRGGRKCQDWLSDRRPGCRFPTRTPMFQTDSCSRFG